MKAKRQIKVMVVDDHPAFRMGVAALIESQPDMVLAGETGDGSQVLDVYRQHRPDVVLMDLRLQGASGVEAIIALRKEFTDAKVIVLTTYDTDEDIYRACQAGVKSYLLKDTPKEEILAAIRAAYAGQPVMPNKVADRLAKRMLREDLSQRELEVLQALVKGRSNKEIAVALGISEPTVKTHLQNLFTKLGVQDRVGAVIAAIKHGIVHLE